MTKCESPWIQEKSVGTTELHQKGGEFSYQSEPVVNGLSQLGAQLNPFFLHPNPFPLLLDLSVIP